MLFNSLEFLAFAPLVVALYFAAPQRIRWGLLLAASYWFYAAWEPRYLLIILASTVVDYVAGRAMGRHDTRRGRRPWLVVSLVANLGLLFTFKYLNFVADAVSPLLERWGVALDSPVLDVLLPVGISFYTFQTLSYTIDVYRGQREPERHLGMFALYVAFFPQLVAGPIERSTRLLPQLHARHEFDYDRVVSGLRLALWGFVKKIVIADRVARYVDVVYANPDAHGAPALWLATYFFAIQIYCDFSGYSDIAIGTARVLGVELMENFKRPYFARSIQEFWQRWHVSLSTWFRDYLYIPLGGNRVARWRWYANLMIVFVVSGIWHGANWTFLVWGAIHGGLLILESAFGWSKRSDAPWRATDYARALVTFHLVCLAWVFFRASDLTAAGDVLGGMVSFGGEHEAWSEVALGPYELAVAGAWIAVLFAVDLLERRQSWPALLGTLGRPARWAVYYALGLGILVFGVFGVTEFLYFQF